jgi:hypothetical protein
MGKRSRRRERDAQGLSSQDSAVANTPAQSTSPQPTKGAESHDPQGILIAESTPLVTFIYVVLPTLAMCGLVTYYFLVTNISNSFVIVAVVFLARIFPTATKRWLGKPIPTNRPSAHAMRLYCMLIIILIPYLLIFSTLYYSLAGNKYPNNCISVQLTKTSSLYFTATTFTTTGFGDIHATSPACQRLGDCTNGLGVYHH